MNSKEASFIPWQSPHYFITINLFWIIIFLTNFMHFDYFVHSIDFLDSLSFIDLSEISFPDLTQVDVRFLTFGL